MVANYNNSQIKNPVVTVPGNMSYSSATKYGKKICVVGDSHIRRIKRNLFNNSLCKEKSHLNGFSGTNIYLTFRSFHYSNLGRRSTSNCDHLHRIQ